MSGNGSTIPELDLARVQRWCAARVPEHVRDEVRVECDVSGRAVTILECRPPGHPDAGPEWMRQPIARLRYTKSRTEWTLYWADRNAAFHRYDLVEPCVHVADLLAEVDRDPTCVFWG